MALQNLLVGVVCRVGRRGGREAHVTGLFHRRGTQEERAHSRPKLNGANWSALNA